jgi:hypothetical protein
MSAKYFSFLKAAKRLKERLNATPEEIAAWVFMGELTGYEHVDEFDDPPKFYFAHYLGESQDYIGVIQGRCYFSCEDVENFRPESRYITYENVLSRWLPVLKTECRIKEFIRAKEEESALLSFHPLTGCTNASDDSGHYPGMETGLYPLEHIETIEREDFPVSDVSELVLLNDPIDPKTHYKAPNFPDEFPSGILAELEKAMERKARMDAPIQDKRKWQCQWMLYTIWCECKGLCEIPKGKKQGIIDAFTNHKKGWTKSTGNTVWDVLSRNGLIGIENKQGFAKGSRRKS